MKSNLKRAGGKNKAIVALCVLLAVTILLGIVGFTGLSFLNVPRWLPTANSDNWPDSLPLGLDLQGGVYVEYTGKVPEGSDKTFEDLVDGTISRIRARLTEAGQTEANIQRIGTNGIRVEIPIKRTQASTADTAAELNAANPETGTEPATTVAPEQGTIEEGTTEETKTEEGTTEEGASEESKTEETATEESKTEETAAEESKTEETATEEGKTEETATEEGASEEKPADEGKTEEAASEEEHDHSEEETAEETVTDEYHAGMKTIFEEMSEDGYVAYYTASGGYGFAPVSEDGEIAEEIDFSDNDAISKVLDLIGKRAVMRFVDADGYVFMTGDKVESARYVSVTSQNAASSSNQIEFHLTEEGKKLFAEATTKYNKRSIAIWLDNECLVNATVNEPILDGTGLISGSYTQEEATAVAAKIQSGALPLILTQDKVDMVSATLGQDALSSSVTAAFIGILLIMALMIFRYRLNGAIASWALTIYVIVLFGLIALFKVQLTLPGLAGIVLGIGMAVDANVIIFERFNEEARKGCSAKASVRAGFKNALSAILDANVTTLIAAVVLMIFGTGSIRGFAYTLLLGVIVSMFTAILVTRFLMNRFVDAGCTEIRLFAKVKAEEEVEQ